jgi:hypothetical protein
MNRPPGPSRDPLAGVTRLFVDGTNLLHALSRGPERQPPSAIIGRLRGAVPLTVQIELVFDGPTERGIRGERIAQGLRVRFSGRFSADTILVTLVDDAVGGAPAGASDAILVVTDDRELRGAVARRGARTAGTTWLIRRLERPPRSVAMRPVAATEEEETRPGWSPGRGATKKRGNPRRAPRR